MKAQRLIAGALAVLLPAAVSPLALAIDAPAPPQAGCPLYGDAGQAQMQRMHAMSEAMAAAKTPEERQRLMQQALPTLQAGMAMMQDCPMGGTGNTAAREQMMERHVAMMQTMMPVMVQMMGMGPGAAVPQGNAASAPADLMGQGALPGMALW